MKTYTELDVKNAQIEKKLKIAQQSDEIKPSFVPLQLAKEMINKIPAKKPNDILVISDTGLLIETYRKWKNSNIIFLCHTKEAQEIANQLKILSIYAPYSELDEWLKRDINMKFDVIIGNPPYQGEKRGGGVGSGNAIWQLFIELSFLLLKPNGYLASINPIQWRINPIDKKYQKVHDILMSKQFIYIKLFQTPWEKVGVVVDWYVVKNVNNEKEAIIDFVDCQNKKIIENEIVNYGSKEVENIIKKVFQTDNNNLFLRKSFGGLKKLDKTKPKGKYKFAHGAQYTKNKWNFDEYPHIHQNNPKVIIAGVKEFRAIYDSGEIGISDHIHYILVRNEKEGNFMVAIINSKLMNFICNRVYATDMIRKDGKPARWQNPYPISRIKIDNVLLDNENDVYQYFNLTQKEIDLIENAI